MRSTRCAVWYQGNHPERPWRANDEPELRTWNSHELEQSVLEFSIMKEILAMKFMIFHNHRIEALSFTLD